MRIQSSMESLLKLRQFPATGQLWVNLSGEAINKAAHCLENTVLPQNIQFFLESIRLLMLIVVVLGQK
jgi:hypothetical protein